MRMPKSASMIEGVLTCEFEDGTVESFDTLAPEEANRLKRKRSKEQWERENACTISTRCSRDLATRYSQWCYDHGTTPYRHLRTYVEKSVNKW